MNEAEKFLEDNKIISSGIEMISLSLAKEALVIRETELRLDSLEEKEKEISLALKNIETFLESGLQDYDKDSP